MKNNALKKWHTGTQWKRWRSQRWESQGCGIENGEKSVNLFVLQVDPSYTDDTVIISIRSTNGSFNKSLWDSVKYLECTNVVLIPKHILNHSPVSYKGVWFDQSKIWSIQHRNLQIFFPWHQPLEASIRHIYVCSRKEPLLQLWVYDMRSDSIGS